MTPAGSLFADRALLPEGWARNVRIAWDGAGRVASVESGVAAAAGDTRLGTRVLMPAPANLHSHTFQRAMAGMTETRGADATDSFWTWRAVMYRFLDQLTPDQVEAIAALAFMEMAEAGYAAVAEFHYLHHRPGGGAYASPAELSERIVAAAEETGIGLTLLPVLYERGGCTGEPLRGGQKRFGHAIDRFAALVGDCETLVARAANRDTRLGIAPHSLRAVSPEGLDACVRLAAGRPLHMHIAEQTAEIDEVTAAYGRRPLEWLFDRHDVGRNWCLIHCTHASDAEIAMLAQSGATAGLCPLTEASLGDGIFQVRHYVAAGGALGIGTDSNIAISVFRELQALEYSQRLRDRQRAIFATRERSAGRALFDRAVAGGAAALARPGGAIAVGSLADLVAVETDSHWFDHAAGDEILDRLIFTDPPADVVGDVWSAGRHIVSGGRHRHRDAVVRRYRAALRSLLSAA